MTDSSVQPRNILLTMKQVYNARYIYKKSVRGDRTEMQQLMLLLERDMYVHWSRFEERTNVVQHLWSTHCYPIAKTWCSYYTSRKQMFTQIMSIRRHL